MIATPLIDESYFDKTPVYINLSGVGAPEKLNDAIIEYQNKILLDALGVVEFDKLSTDITTNPLPQKWDKFLNGYTYSYKNISYNYLGFKEVLKYFIYFYYRRQSQITQTSLGDVKPKLENSLLQAINADVVRIYNKGIELYGCDYTRNVCEQYEELKPTAFNFLYHNNILFPDWYFSGKKKLNMFSL